MFFIFLADMFDLYNIFSIFAEIKVVHGWENPHIAFSVVAHIRGM